MTDNHEVQTTESQHLLDQEAIAGSLQDPVTADADRSELIDSQPADYFEVAYRLERPRAEDQVARQLARMRIKLFS